MPFCDMALDRATTRLFLRNLLKCPHLRVAEGHLGWMTIVYIWVSNEPTLAVAGGAHHQNDKGGSFWGMDFQDG